MCKHIKLKPVAGQQTCAFNGLIPQGGPQRSYDGTEIIFERRGGRKKLNGTIQSFKRCAKLLFGFEVLRFFFPLIKAIITIYYKDIIIS